MFQPIQADDLRYNQKYKIVAGDVYSGIYKGKLWNDNLYLEFDEVCNLTSDYYSPRFFMPTRMFFKFVSQKERIQNDMERRAVNRIIQKILFDPYFTW